ncbi:DUF5667 domain-containing protein [Sediminibacillus halophilus]|uniref:DUF5667 domain-containing protein n=1 Tax=Sediminibacillus halophilus TaxID=482461 RepID=A0A1G9R5L0_9BACI|nr:DUF5667 domain-containing protein [Sediminibacillus halophilus]SDM18569.1 hypothetical protein SAMN05216244_1833 [Sediminibacillus halophilus]
MKKTIVSSTLGLLLLFAGNVYAAEDETAVDPNSELYDTSRVIEEAEYELTEENSEKALLQDEYADDRLNEAEVSLDKGDEANAEELLEDYEEHVKQAEEDMEAAKENGEDISTVEETLVENSQKRSENLRALLEREDLPEEAKAGIAKALENQQKAEQNYLAARKKAEEAQEVAQEEAQEETQEKEQEKAQEKQEKAQEKAQEKQEKAQEKAQEKQEKAQEKAQAQQEKAQEKAQAQQEKAQEKAQAQQEKAQEKQEKAQEKASEQQGRASGRP